MTSELPIVTLGPSSEEVIVDASIPAYPQSLAANLWRYDRDKNPVGKAGSFKTGVSAVTLGLPIGIRGHFYLLEGAVLSQDDDPPTPYEVVVRVRQGKTVLHECIPTDGGKGTVGKADVPFCLRFGLE